MISKAAANPPERIELAATFAADLGLEVWFAPYPLELATEELLGLLADCAERADRVRSRGGAVVFVTDAELSLMNTGFLPGFSMSERVELLSVGLDRPAEVADQFAAGVRTLLAQGKPAAITEFGAATFQGAGDMGARGLEIVEHPERGSSARLNGEYTRDEAGQAAYLRELLEIFETEGIDSALVFLFALYDHPHRPGGDPRNDLDLASYGIVKAFEDRHGDTYPDMPWEPEATFAPHAEFYRATPVRTG